MTAHDTAAVLDALLAEYGARANAIRRDLGRSHSADFAEQAQQRQNDGGARGAAGRGRGALRQVGLAKQRLAEGRYGECQRCGEPIEAGRLRALPAAEFCLRCAALN